MDDIDTEGHDLVSPEETPAATSRPHLDDVSTWAPFMPHDVTDEAIPAHGVGPDSADTDDAESTSAAPSSAAPSSAGSAAADWTATEPGDAEFDADGADLGEAASTADNEVFARGRAEFGPARAARVEASTALVASPLSHGGALLTDPLPAAPDADIVPLVVQPTAQRLGGRRFLQGVLLGSLVASIVTAAIGFAFFETRGQVTTQATFDVGQILRIIEPAVVKVEVRSETQGQGAGTGFVISPDGDIVTNAHVVDGAAEIVVVMSDGAEFPATLLGADPTRDLAVIKIEASGLVVAELGSSAEIQVGDPVLAIGNALDLAGGPTVTTGIVSALDRRVPTETTRLTNVLQTDAAINPGNSGGPLVNSAGEVIGISTAIAGNAEGIGFAIEIDHARPVIESLAIGVVPSRPLLGVSVVDVSDVSDTDREDFGIVPTEGAVISRLSEGEAADAAGLEVGDVVVEFNGHVITSSSDLVAAVRASAIGAENQVVFFRGESRMVEFVVLGELLGAGG